jgi:hypothetical protein
LFDLFPIRNSLKEGDALWPLFVNFALEMRHQERSDKPGWFENIRYISAFVNILGGRKKNTEAL